MVVAMVKGAELKETDMASTSATAASVLKYPPYSGRGLPQVQGQKTGFFHTEKQGDKWWLIDPNGKGFYIFGVQCVTYDGYVLGRRPYHASVFTKYGSEEAWVETTIQRLQDWGFNMVGQGSAESLRYRGLAHIEWLWAGEGFVDQDNLVPRTESCGSTGFPNVFSPDWPAYCDKRAKEMCAPHRDDPWLLGYYLDNEIQWWGTYEAPAGEHGIALEAMKKSADHTAKQAWIRLVREYCPTIEDFNRAWGTKYASFDELATSTTGHIPQSKEAKEMTRQYLRLAAELYFRETTAALRRHDPNHLVLGCRIAVIAPDEVWNVCGKYCDVVTFNLYPPVHPDRGLPREFIDYFQSIYDKCGKPIFLTEWSVAAQSEAPPSGGGFSGNHVFDQEQRARSAASFQRTLLSMPFMIGTSWMMYANWPLGEFATTFETINSGLVNRLDEPYKELTDAFTAVHRQAFELHMAGVYDAVYDPPPPVRWSHPLPEGQSQTAAEDAVFCSGALQLAPGKDGAWTVKYDGHAVATWRPGLWQGQTEETCIKSTHCFTSGVRQDERFTVVDAEFEGQSSDGATFKAGWRFWVPRNPSGWCGAQCLWIENAGSASLNAIYLVPWHQHEGIPRDDPGVLSRANNQGFYIPLGAVDHSEQGIGFGVTVVEQGAELVHDRAGDNTAWATYCRQGLGVELKAGQRHTVDGPVIMLFGYSAGEPSGLLTALKERVGKARTEAEAFCK